MSVKKHTHSVDEFFGQIGKMEPAGMPLLTNSNPTEEIYPVKLRNSVFCDELREAVQDTLSALAGKTMASYSDQKESAEAISDLAHGGRWQLTFDDTPVKLRAVNPKKTKTGYFQLRALWASQSSVYTGKSLPKLVVRSL